MIFQSTSVTHLLSFIAHLNLLLTSSSSNFSFSFNLMIHNQLKPFIRCLSNNIWQHIKIICYRRFTWSLVVTSPAIAAGWRLQKWIWFNSWQIKGQKSPIFPLMFPFKQSYHYSLYKSSNQTFFRGGKLLEMYVNSTTSLRISKGRALQNPPQKPARDPNQSERKRERAHRNKKRK